MSDLTTMLQDLNKARLEIESEIADKKASGETFNVFELCGVGHYETMHSSILAEFLSPAGAHGMGEKFLRNFAGSFGIGEYSKKAEVKTELSEKIGGEKIGRFDILIQDVSTHHVCIIENKIYAREQPEQLERYGRWLNRRAKEGWKTHLVFLTLDGHESVSVKEDQEYVQVAYSSYRQCGEGKYDIVNWLKQCSKLAKGRPSVANALLQYSDHLKNLSMGEIAMSDKIIEVLQRNMKAAQDAYTYYTAACERAANMILVEEIPRRLGRVDQWTAYPGCSWKKRTQGVRYVPNGGEELKGQIYVIFDEKELGGCEIVLYQEKGVTNSRPICILKDQEKSWSRQGWDVDCTKWSEYPFWRPVRCGVKEEEDPIIYKYGAWWGGEFFDRMNKNPAFRKTVIDEIVNGIKDLYEIQRILSKH